MPASSATMASMDATPGPVPPGARLVGPVEQRELAHRVIRVPGLALNVHAGSLSSSRPERGDGSGSIAVIHRRVPKTLTGGDPPDRDAGWRALR
jgi:hypothetical protein